MNPCAKESDRRKKRIALRRRERPSERGSAVLVSLLVVLALTGLGLVGLKHTTFEIRQSGNARLQKQATYTSEAGMMIAMQKVGTNGETYWRYMNRLHRVQGVGVGAPANGNAAGDIQPEVIIGADGVPELIPRGDKPSYRFHMEQFATARGLFGSGTDDFQHRQDVNAGFDVVFSDPKDGPRPPGYSKDFCFKRFTFTSLGTISEPNAADRVLNFREPQRNSQARHVAHALVGPMLCDEGYGN